MTEKIRATGRGALRFVTALLKWMAVGAVVGIVGGLVGTAFHVGVEKATELRLAHPAILYTLPLAGLLIAWLYRVCRLEGRGTNQIIESVHFGKDVPLLLVPLIFVSTCLTHLAGGSAGREGAALQIGGGIGHKAGELLHLGPKELPLATLCGMSAVFAALFGTPITATIFALEVISVGVLYYAGLVPCLTSALTAFWVSELLGVEPTRYPLAAPPATPDTLWRVAVISVGFALVALLFCRCLHITEHLANRWVKNSYLRAVVGSAILIALTLVLGRDYNGAGMEIVSRAVDGAAVPWAWAAKILFTAVTIGFGFKGGEVVPSFFVGATFGCVVAPLVGLDAAFGAALGLVAVFCGAVNCPIASLLLGVELFGGQGVLCFAAACAISYLLSGYVGLYSSQTILYSKLRAEYINIHTEE